MAAVSYDAILVNGVLAPFYSSGWPLIVAGAAVAAAGSAEPRPARGRALSFAIALAVAYLLEHLYGTGIGNFLQQHRLPAAIAVAAVLLLEGLSVVGVQSLWAKLRGRTPDGGSSTDNVTAAVIGAGMAFAVSLLNNQAALSRAAVLADAGQLGAALVIVAIVSFGVLAAVLVVLHLMQMIWQRIGREAWRVRGSGAVMVVLAILIALQQIR